MLRLAAVSSRSVITFQSYGACPFI